MNRKKITNIYKINKDDSLSQKKNQLLTKSESWWFNNLTTSKESGQSQGRYLPLPLLAISLEPSTNVFTSTTLTPNNDWYVYNLPKLAFEDDPTQSTRNLSMSSNFVMYLFDNQVFWTQQFIKKEIVRWIRLNPTISKKKKSKKNGLSGWFWNLRTK